MKNKRLKIITIAIATMFIACTLKSQTLDGTTWSYTEKVYNEKDVSEVTMYFGFTSTTNVIWYFSTHDNFVFPVGFGTYDAKSGTITFLHTNPLNKWVRETIILNFYSISNQATMTFKDEWQATRFYNDGRSFKLNKEKYSLSPNSRLVGTSWRLVDATEEMIIYFKSINEVLIDGEMSPYVCLGNNVSIKTGDNLTRENVVGNYNGNIMYLHQSGIAHITNDYYLTFKKIE